ncbi:hypothetical protein G195_000255 [Phytophthora kernoviae 00238/432]|uniref:AAA+ ATPase domain-containing protein n=1 Tax=Phytophthora kernoviae 00238/432 TaxID=1284355 RepID=A0A8J4SWT9_9STRA|nr:hypothetical protein G195_000255 [Phytophthora kernoviae 00238/432]
MTIFPSFVELGLSMRILKERAWLSIHFVFMHWNKFYRIKDSKFSDGSPLTADDVAFTWTILHDKSYDGGFDIFSTKVKGGKAYTEGKADHIEGIQVVDPLTISVTLEQPNATALLTLGSEVLSKAYYGKDYQFGKLEYIKNLHATPVGNGPYKLEKFIPGQEVRFVANEFYYKGKPKTEHFIYKTSEGDTWQFIETGEIDFTSFTATQENIDKLKNIPYLNLLPYTPSTYGYLQLNLEHEQLQEKEVRQALTYGLDRQSIYVDANQGAGAVANIPTSPISWSYTEEGINPYAYDPDKANQLLDDAGWAPGADGIREKNGKKLSLHFLGTKSPATDIFIAVAKENFEAIGVQFQPEVFADFNSLVSKVEGGDYDVASFSTAMLTDPSDGVLQFVDGELKGYDNPKVKELYNKGGMMTTGSNATGLAYVKEVIQHMTLPVIVMTLLGVGSLTRYFRSNMIDVIKQDYIRTARAKAMKQGPGIHHWLGTDALGRDVLTRVLMAGRISLTVGLASMVLSVFIGSLLGAIAGYYRGIVDQVIMRIADLLLTIPGLPLLFIFGALLSDWKVPPDSRMYIVMLMLSFVNWPDPKQKRSLNVREGETVCIVGESGCGKSVTAMSIMGLIEEPAGKVVGGAIRFGGRDLLRESKSSLRAIRGNDISMIFQEPMSSLNPVLKIGEQLMEPLIVHLKMSKKQARARAVELIAEVGISRPEQIANSYPHELSGGMLQRIMIAIAISFRNLHPDDYA